MKFRVLAALSAIGCLFASAPAPAGYQYVLTGITNGEVIPIGTTRTVNLFLNFDGTGTNALPGGIFSAWTGMRYTQGTTASLSIVNPPQPDGAQASASTGIKANPDFNDSPTRGALPGNTAFSNVTGFTRLYALLAGATTAPYAQSTSAANTANGGTATSLYLGSFNIRFDNTAGANVPLTLQANLYDFTQPLSNINTGQFQNLDAQTQPGVINFTVAGVPEPGTMALVGFAATGFGGVLWRKRRTVAKAKSEE